MSGGPLPACPPPDPWWPRLLLAALVGGGVVVLAGLAVALMALRLFGRWIVGG